MTLLDRLIDPQLPDKSDKIPLHSWRAAFREHLRENPTGNNAGGEITSAQFLAAFDITAQGEIDALDALKADMLAGTLGLSAATLTQAISNNPSKAEVEAIQNKLNELIELLRTVIGSEEMFDLLAMGEYGDYTKAQVSTRLGI